MRFLVVSKIVFDSKQLHPCNPESVAENLEVSRRSIQAMNESSRSGILNFARDIFALPQKALCNLTFSQIQSDTGGTSEIYSPFDSYV
jgi:hypothetical protein